ncbi:MAG: hypothetical protein A2Y35_00015 [Spirochaetes bacterium GWE1_60_18]|nr:MAG: hypothetical protein A2Y35_00015 [Spirochaetes bacterium GWE1_60_18]
MFVGENSHNGKGIRLNLAPIEKASWKERGDSIQAAGGDGSIDRTLACDSPADLVIAVPAITTRIIVIGDLEDVGLTCTAIQA